MKKYLHFILIVAFSLLAPTAQAKTYRVFFTDKGAGEFAPGSELYYNADSSLSERAKTRRKFKSSYSEIIRIEDAPINSEYKSKIEALGAKILLQLKWNNYAVVSADSAIIDTISKLPFVKKTQATSSKLLPYKIESVSSATMALSTNYPELYAISDCGSFDYGYSAYQIKSHKIDSLHKLGITGEGAILGFLDSGFRWRAHKSTSGLNIIKEYDFVNNDTITANQDGDDDSQDHHGSAVLSTACGYLPGYIIGDAPTAGIMLAKTENIPTETMIEEDAFAAGVEWLEANGADIISASLGYFTLDSGEESHTEQDLDGKTTICTRALNEVCKLGVLPINAAGNNGPLPTTISAPSDADSAVAVAADSLYLGAARFSSRGPRIDGAQKPNISALGVLVACLALGDDMAITFSNGTSLAAPQISGMATLLLASRQDLKPWQIKDALYKNSSKYPNPNYDVGYGYPNMLNALKSLGYAFGTPAVYSSANIVRIAINVISEEKVEPYLHLIVAGNTYAFKMSRQEGSYIYFADVRKSIFNLQDAKYYFTLDEKDYRHPYFPEENYDYKYNDERVPCGQTVSYYPQIVESTDYAEIFPNMLAKQNKNLNVSLPMSNLNDASAKIYNTIGQEIYAKNISRSYDVLSNFTIDCSSLPVGVFIIKITYGERSFTGSFIVID